MLNTLNDVLLIEGEKINIFFLKLLRCCVNIYKAPHYKIIFFFLKVFKKFSNYLNKIFAIKIDIDKINVIVFAMISE